ncbi:polysialyltransferase family glycosyltransferase [Phaeodactylibacter sp.]|uniref:polysialyltransferase family glycosyltransferase n=1 Tax=Phaeodactylibacter sp. TaxID=1940289 RepID=UPI002600A280|nr:polysialyltransferase family glycosyltransferase [Phaeodactylibacter sp.]MCI5055313.1 alpha-2,8-polysialyltransferase family protein [Flavobacteriales bacterium]MCI5090790.1 alpha-2,8-polysialyltransferase family protein [Phaeodactylibacter sp.]
MKHIFCVHSPITYLLATLIINSKKLSNNDVILLVKKIKLDFGNIQSFMAFESTARSVLKKIIYLNEPRAFDNYITSITQKEKFTAYVPLMDVYHRLLVTHSNCVNFNFIEEGMMSYRKSTQLNHLYRNYKFSLRHSILNNPREVKKSIIYILRGWTLRILEMPFTYEAYAHLKGVEFYSISPEAYPIASMEKKIVLPLKSSPTMNALAKGILLTEPSLIWLEDNYAENNGIAIKVYEKAIEQSLSRVKKKFPQHQIYLKLRPSTTIKDSPVARILDSKNISFLKIDDDVVLEALMAINKNLTFIGNVSSALFYAKQMGHSSWSIYDFFDIHSNRTFNDFPLYWNNVQKL